jgi:hypothetical protein
MEEFWELPRLAWLRTLKYSYAHCLPSYLSSQFPSWPGSQVICILYVPSGGFLKSYLTEVTANIDVLACLTNALPVLYLFVGWLVSLSLQARMKGHPKNHHVSPLSSHGIKHRRSDLNDYFFIRAWKRLRSMLQKRLISSFLVPIYLPILQSSVSLLSCATVHGFVEYFLKSIEELNVYIKWHRCERLLWYYEFMLYSLSPLKTHLGMISAPARRMPGLSHESEMKRPRRQRRFWASRKRDLFRLVKLWNIESIH